MIISRTPLRISFCGGGTDFEDYYKINGGEVISTTIDKYIYVGVNRMFGGGIRVRYTQNETVSSPEQLNHNIVRSALIMMGINRAIEVEITSDIPSQGSGLGSSSALCVGLLKALYRFKGYDIPADELAEKAVRLEVEILKAPIGIQDHYAAAYGGFNHLAFYPSGGVEVENLYRDGMGNKIKWLQDSTMLFYLHGRDSNEILREFKSGIKEKWETLDKQKSLVLPFKRWIHSFAKNPPEYVGKLISDSWLYKKEITPSATSPLIDQMFVDFMGRGALGGKLCGAGGGGFLMVLCEEKNQEDVIVSLKDCLHLKFNFERKGAEIIYAD
jgi:D-glycero-alpha-D-manno-heptose-7-phosphate kinase